MPLFRLIGFATLGCGCLVGRYRDTTLDREIDYVEQQGQGCHQADHCRDHAVVSDVLPPGAAAFVTPPARTNATR